MKIMAKVSQIILETKNKLTVPDKKKPAAKGKDTVEITSTGNDMLNVARQIDNAGVDTKRLERIESIKSSISKGEYKLTDEMVDSIAGNIAKMFL